mgnify:FL=1
MSKPVDSQDGTGIIHNLPGVGIMIAVAATSAAAGTVGFGPGAILLTTTTNKVYVNTGTRNAATWTVVGTQS